jgi:hypothetical protein
VWCVIPTYVVSDTPDLVVTYLPSGAPFSFPPGPWPTPNGLHPWHAKPAWDGHGLLMLQRPGDPYGVWVFWDGPERSFECWYLNIHEWSRDPRGHAIRDLELDVVVYPDGRWRLKDEDLVDVRVAEGRMSLADKATAHTVAADLVAMVEGGETWWDPGWSDWTPPAAWTAPVSGSC